MQTLVHADIFFFVSTIALVVLSIGLAVGLYYAIGILRDVREVSARVNRASVSLEEDFQSLRDSVKMEGRKVKGIANLFLGFIAGALVPKVRRRKKVEVDLEADGEGEDL